MLCTIWYHLYNSKNRKTPMEECHFWKLKPATLLKVTGRHGCFSLFQIVQMIPNRAKYSICKWLLDKSTSIKYVLVFSLTPILNPNIVFIHALAIEDYFCTPVKINNLNHTLRKIPQFHLISWCGNFAERHSCA